MKHFKNIHVGGKSIVVTGVQSSKTVPPVSLKLKINNAEITEENKVVPWGVDNLYPNNFYNNKFLKNGAAVGGQAALRGTHYGTGIQLVKEIQNESTQEIDLQKQLISKYADIKLFFKENNINKFFFGKITDQSLFNLSFTEHVLSMDQNSIVRAKRHKAAHCRYAPQDKDGNIPFVYINTDWKNYTANSTLEIVYIDTESMTVEEIKLYCKEKGIYNFITSSCHPLVDESYYPKTAWHAVDRSGWMDVANSVPELKKAIFENQLHFKYMIYVSDYYFESFYKEEWDDFDADKRQKLREDLSKNIDDYMSGNEAAGRSLVSPIFEENGKFVEGIKVEPIDNKLKDGSYLPDASAANVEILFAMAVDPVIIGAINAGSNQGRSGSDKREAYTILSANLTPIRHITVDDFELWRDFNGWDEDLIAVFPSVNLTTLDKNPNGQTTVING